MAIIFLQSLIALSPFEGELALFLLLGFCLEDKPFGELDLDDDLAAGRALREGDQDAAGEVLADLDGDLVGTGARGDVEAVDADAFADRFQDVGAGAARDAHEGVGELDRFGMADVGDIFVKQNESQDGAGGFLGIRLEGELGRSEGTAQHRCDGHIGEGQRSVEVEVGGGSGFVVEDDLPFSEFEDLS